jgi:hypothetical protein
VPASNALQVHRESVNTTIQLTTGTTGSAGGDGFSLVSEIGTTDAYIIQRENANLTMRTNNINRMRIDNAGNVFLGTNTVAGQNTGGLTIQGQDVQLMTIMQAY